MGGKRRMSRQSLNPTFGEAGATPIHVRFVISKLPQIPFPFNPSQIHFLLIRIAHPESEGNEGRIPVFHKSVAHSGLAKEKIGFGAGSTVFAAIAKQACIEIIGDLRMAIMGKAVPLLLVDGLE